MVTRLTKRNLRSYYYDKITKTVSKATACKSYPFSRPHRYIFIGQYSSCKTESSLWGTLFANYGIRRPRPKVVEDLPF